MTENEDKKIISLFEEYARKEIPDDGFTGAGFIYRREWINLSNT